MVCKKAEDADGLVPIKDENEFARHSYRKGCLIFIAASYQRGRAFIFR